MMFNSNKPKDIHALAPHIIQQEEQEQEEELFSKTFLENRNKKTYSQYDEL